MANSSFFFYDLETSGVNPRSSRIMQFAGQRTDMGLNPIGEPYNILIKLTDDVLPEPDAILITGITPQQTLADGVTEAEFAKLFYKEIVTPGTIFTGFNSIRFDDEFMRFLFWRNFYDPYEWQWKDGCSRWDLLDITRMARALRPDGIEWPFASDGKPTNRLELLTELNGLDHTNAHDALSDVHATIAVAKLLRDKQPKLFDYLISMRDKRQVEALVTAADPFVYSSGKYSSDHQKTTVALCLGSQTDRQGVFVYDLRYDPQKFMDLSPEKLADIWRYTKDPAATRLPIKGLQFNKCPAVAPLSVLDDATKERLQIDMKTIRSYAETLRADQDFIGRVQKAAGLLSSERQTAFMADDRLVDTQLYDGFVPDTDKKIFSALHDASPESIRQFAERFKDQRLASLLPFYKARNFPKFLSDEERAAWEQHRSKTILGGGANSLFARFTKRLQELAAGSITPEKQYLLEELHLYAESILPEAE